MQRTRLIGCVLLATGVLLAACRGGPAGPDGGREDGAPAVSISCEAISGIQSYRYSISLKLKTPAFEQPTEGTPQPPLSGFAEQLSQLFSDMTLEGAFVAPDRSQTIMRFQDEELELRTIGDRSWVRVGSFWQEQEGASPAALLTPQAVCKDLVRDLGPSLAGAKPQEDTVNSIEAQWYHLDRTNLQGIQELLGRGTGDLPSEFAVDVWLAKEGRWPVRLRISAADTDEEGRTVSLDLFMEFSAINDPSIEIEPPPISPSQL